MAEEKIKKQIEAELNDEQLDEIAGGSKQQGTGTSGLGDLFSNTII